MTVAPLVVRQAIPLKRQPDWSVPAGGWDTHAHVFGEPTRYPQRLDRRYVAPVQTVDRYLATLDGLGVTHGVLVQPSVYGKDNSCLLDALALAPDRLVGVVDIDVLHTGDSDIAAMTRMGVCGLRVAWKPDYEVAWLRDQCRRLRDVGWHLDLRVDDISQFVDLAPVLAELDIPIMIESMGSPRADEHLCTRGFRALIELLRGAQVYVKLSHPYQIDVGGPPYAAVAPIARAIVERIPHRTVWGSDWPHPMHPRAIMPDDTDLIDLLAQWAGDLALASHLLCTNPSRFYSATLAQPGS